ncbi:hypothetical protein [Dactylosporangium matsuzakiense]|uniref:Uncharacterized protein n=1 Tax=Dactylosporangium matsuzakiense TaxID=53360 RepID=A0A9W6KW08_9ACTN|nr:hypothetical protein [Dactylosporangium matsuzakiense]UWZ42406.1 hypothetical protein Dmats_33230 [Dactylosporangium matsuzakiense]GLL07611.1 hypothetical protein GCM10017581_093650 [Dactylosporangium matsuzakiense]
MSDKPLTPVQRSALLVLMAEGREVPNAFLTNVRKLELKKANRDDLFKRQMITVRKAGQLVFLELDDRGWEWCEGQFAEDVETPPLGGHGSAAAYAIMASIGRAVTEKRQVRSLGDFFARIDAEAAAPDDDDPETATEADADTETAIRTAYRRLARRPGDWVELAQLRPALNGILPSVVDATLVAMSILDDVSIVPESNQKVLTPEQIGAAVRIGNQNKHLISIQ